MLHPLLQPRSSWPAGERKGHLPGEGAWPRRLAIGRLSLWRVARRHLKTSVSVGALAGNRRHAPVGQFEKSGMKGLLTQVWAGCRKVAKDSAEARGGQRP